MPNSKFILALVGLGSPAIAQEAPTASSREAKSDTEVTVFAASNYITGELEDREYETVSLAAGAQARIGRVFVGASLPYIVTSAPEELIVSSGGLLGTSLLSRRSNEPRRVTREGIGDLALQADYQLPLGGLTAVIGGSIKVPTASRDAALGTGEVDFGINGQISRRFGDVIPFVTAGYAIIGEPDGFDVRNTWSGAAGGQFVVGPASSVSLSYNYEQSATRLVRDSHAVGLGLSTGLTSRLQLGVDARAGLSSDAPDARLGIRLGVGF